MRATLNSLTVIIIFCYFLEFCKLTSKLDYILFILKIVTSTEGHYLVLTGIYMHLIA
jgi:hypothetical protein